MEITIKRTIDRTLNGYQPKIIAYLNDSGYRVKQKSDHAIIFDDEIDTGWRIRSNLSYYKISEARFDLITNENDSVICLTYNLDIAFETLFITGSTICAIYIDHIYSIASLVITLNLLFKFYVTRTEGKNILKNVLKIGY